MFLETVIRNFFSSLPVVDSVWLLLVNGGGSGGTMDVKSEDDSTCVGALRITGVTNWLWVPVLLSNLWKKEHDMNNWINK